MKRFLTYCLCVTLLLGGCERTELKQVSTPSVTVSETTTATPEPSQNSKPESTEPLNLDALSHSILPDSGADARYYMWGDSEESVRLREEESGQSRFLAELSDFIVYETTLDCGTFEVFYRFAEDELISVGFVLDKDVHPESERAAKYEELRCILVSAFGEPTAERAEENAYIVFWILDSKEIRLFFKLEESKFDLAVSYKIPQDKMPKVSTLHLMPVEGADARGVTWGASPDEVKQFEARDSNATFDKAGHNSLWYKTQLDCALCTYFYSFENNKLNGAVFRLEFASPEEAAVVFSNMTAQLEAIYGNPFTTITDGNARLTTWNSNRSMVLLSCDQNNSSPSVLLTISEI